MNTLSRRGFLEGAVGLAALGPGLARAQAGKKRTTIAYVGTYTGKLGNGKGIHSFAVDPESAALSPLEITPHESSPSSLAFAPAGDFLYSANETADGSVSAFAVDGATGRLKRLNTVPSGGAGPAHLSVHPAGRHVLVANYDGGTIAVLPIAEDGSLLRASGVYRDTGPLGPLHAASAPPGSFAISGHDAPHAHMIQSAPGGKFVLSTDLGLDRIYVWKFDSAAGKLTASDAGFAGVPPGDGPRHFAFHPNGRWLFCLQEEGSTLTRFDYDGATGRLAPRQSLSTLPAGFAGSSFASEIMVSSDGRFVYAANRLHDSIAIFSVGEAGEIKLLGEEWTRGSYPRNFNIDPSGGFMFVCNHRGDAVTTFRIDRASGALAFTGQYTPVGSPSIIVFREIA